VAHWWLPPVIVAMEEAEIKMIAVQDQTGKIVCKILKRKKKRRKRREKKLNINMWLMKKNKKG
jgi:hypothetical protein